MTVHWFSGSTKFLSTYRRQIIIIFCAAGIIAVSGCAGLFVEPYGYVARDGEIIREDGKALFIPTSAPSVAQGYKPQYPRMSEELTSGDHEGIDITAEKGTPVMAAASGTVLRSYYEPFFGNRITLEHGRNDKGLTIRSRYFHLNKRLVKEGETVVRGQQIGELGSTGLLASYPHLHYEVRIAGQGRYGSTPINPHSLWFDGVGIVTCFDPEKRLPDRPVKTTYPVSCRKAE